MMFDELRRKLEAIRRLARKPGNDFTWTGWQDAIEAFADIDTTCAALKLRQPAACRRAQLLLSEDGPLHRLAIDSGWEPAFRRAGQKPELLLIAG